MTNPGQEMDVERKGRTCTRAVLGVAGGWKAHVTGGWLVWCVLHP